MKAKQQDRINAARHFGLHKWGAIKSAALRLALCELQTVEPKWEKPRRIADRFGLGSALAFYYKNPELYWDE